MQLRCLLIGLILLPLAACRVGGDRSISDENDRLRALEYEQRDRISALEHEREELKLRLASPPPPGPVTLSPEALAAIPAITRVDISSLSGFDPADPVRPASSVAVNFSTLDGRGRFTQAVGVATVEAFLVSSEFEMVSEPRQIGSRTLSPAQLRDSYRSGLTGTHYSVDLPLDPVLARPAALSLLLRVQFEDAVTGQTLHANKIIIAPGPRGPRP